MAGGGCPRRLPSAAGGTAGAREMGSPAALVGPRCGAERAGCALEIGCGASKSSLGGPPAGKVFEFFWSASFSGWYLWRRSAGGTRCAESPTPLAALITSASGDAEPRELALERQRAQRDTCDARAQSHSQRKASESSNPLPQAVRRAPLAPVYTSPTSHSKMQRERHTLKHATSTSIEVTVLT